MLQLLESVLLFFVHFKGVETGPTTLGLELDVPGNLVGRLVQVEFVAQVLDLRVQPSLVFQHIVEPAVHLFVFLILPELLPHYLHKVPQNPLRRLRILAKGWQRSLQFHPFLSLDFAQCFFDGVECARIDATLPGLVQTLE